MSVESNIQDRLKEAMRAKDARTADCIRMIKTKHMERRTAAGFKGPLDDNLWLDVIASYQKQLRKSREEYVAVGERGAEAVAQLDFEIGFCAQFLPKAASDDEVRAIVRETVARMGVSDAKQAGRVVGDIMKGTRASSSPPASSGSSTRSWPRPRPERAPAGSHGAYHIRFGACGAVDRVVRRSASHRSISASRGARSGMFA